jgi:hypothetical protein
LKIRSIETQKMEKCCKSIGISYTIAPSSPKDFNMSSIGGHHYVLDFYESV